MFMTPNWTWADYDTVRKNYPSKGEATLELLTDRTPSALLNKAQRLGVSHSTTLLEEEKELLNMYGKALGTAMVFLMPKRTVFEVKEALSCLKD